MVTLMRRFTPWVSLLAVAAALAVPSSASASALIAWNGKHVQFKVGDHNRAVLSYTTRSGLRRHVLIWGAINAKVDFELLDKLTRRLCHWNIVLMGHDRIGHGGLRRRFEDLRRRPNFFYVGLKTREELGGYLQAFDVCMMCYTITEWTRYGLPLKMFLYLATGKPIVSTYLPSLEEYKDHVEICRNHDDFIEAVVTVTVPTGALAILPNAATINTGDGLTFSASGGTLPYTFSIFAGTGSIVGGTGVYTAPAAPDRST